jgi:putative flavoprotein involved in K+ transport
MSRAEVIVVGAGASGLAAAAALQVRGRRPVVLERDERVGGTWERRYDRLCLHTVRRFSGLPFDPLPRSYPRYVPKDDYAQYLHDYADRMGLDIWLGQRVHAIRPSWVVETADSRFEARAVVVASGRHNEPHLPHWDGIEEFEGRLLHSVDYRTGREFVGKRALVIGIGNSGAEIAADLVEQGAARVTIAVRTSPPITSREIAGIPVQLLGMLLMPFPPRAVDRVGAVLRRIGNGDLSRYGLGDEAWGPFTARRPPVIDVGFLEQLKAGRIEVRGDVAHFTRTGVAFADDLEEDFDVIIAATGFTTGLERMLGAGATPTQNGAGLYFAGYAETPRGQLFESSRNAPRLAATVDRYLSEVA